MALVIFQSKFASLNGTDKNYDKFLTFQSHVNKNKIKGFTSFNVHRPREIPSATHVANSLNGKGVSIFNETTLRPYEIIRPITMKEYFILGQLMREHKFILNKKKEKIIKS